MESFKSPVRNIDKEFKEDIIYLLYEIQLYTEWQEDEKNYVPTLPSGDTIFINSVEYSVEISHSLCGERVQLQFQVQDINIINDREISVYFKILLYFNIYYVVDVKRGFKTAKF